MTALPQLAIGLITYKRTAEAVRTVQGVIFNLDYPKENRGWYIADDGSPKEHIAEILLLLKNNGERILGYHNERMRHKGEKDTHNAGFGWNKCLGICHQFSDFVLWLEDDWELETKLDPRKHIKLLTEREDVGLVSYRILSVGCDVHTVGYEGEIFLRYSRSTQYAYSGNPYIRHARFTKKYGWFAEDRNPGNMELHMDDQYRLNDGPDIWRPLTISQWGGFAHIGTDKSWR